MKKYIQALLLLLCSVSASAANGNFSYLYIQGDKKTPFYVKLEDAMQPRYGKNYCIIPKLAPGPAHLEILFQQNVHPAQKFTVMIPEGGHRGFLLVKLDGGYSLYDLQSGFYLPAGNKAEDDRLPATPVATAVSTARGLETPPQKGPSVKTGESMRRVFHAAAAQAQKKKQPATEGPKPATDGKPVFIGDLELGRGARDSTDGAAIGQNGDVPAIVNTDCPAPISTAEFGKVFSAMSAYRSDEGRLEYMYGQMEHCYETWQARTLAGKLSGDAARFALLRKIYPRISDQSAFPLLDDLLTTETWKAEFNKLIRR